MPEHPLQARVALALRPSDPGVADRQRARALEHQAAEAASAAVEDEMREMAADGRPVAARMVPVRELGPFGQVPPAGGDLQRDRLKVPERRVDRLPGLAGLGADGRTAPTARLAPLRQGQDAQRLQLLQDPQAELLPAGSRRRVPAEVLAQRAGQLPPAVVRKQLNRLLHERDLPSRQALAEEGGGLQVLDSRIHNRRLPPDELIRRYDGPVRSMSQARTKESRAGAETPAGQGLCAVAEIRKFRSGQIQCH